MVQISKDEADVIRKSIPQTTIVKTNKKRGSKKGKYLCEESEAAMKLLAKLRPWLY